MTLPNGISQHYNFGDAAQPVSIMDKNTASAMIGDLQYSYDAAGRRTKVNGSFAHTNLPNVVTSAIYDDYDRLTAWNGQGITYDENGNMLHISIKNVWVAEGIANNAAWQVANEGIAGLYASNGVALGQALTGFVPNQQSCGSVRATK